MIDTPMFEGKMIGNPDKINSHTLRTASNLLELVCVIEHNILLGQFSNNIFLGVAKALSY